MNPVVAEMLLISGRNLLIYLVIGTTGLLIGAALAFLLIRLRWARTESESIPGPVDLKQLKEDMLCAIREPLLEMQKSSLGRMEGVISSFRTLEETCAENNAEIKTHISTAISNLSQTVANLPEAINSRFLESLHEEERKRKEAELKRQEQEKKRYEEECERTKQSVRESFYSRLATLQKGSHALKIAVLTRDVFEGLDTAVSNREKLRESFRAYFALVQRADTFRKKIADFADTPNALQSAESELEKEFQSLETEANSLEESHRVIWFVSLLEQANRNRSLDEKVQALRTLLGLEEINILPGHEIKGLDEVDVVSTDGLGSRTIISEVLERGYKERGTGLLVSKPKVRVRLQS